MIELVDIANPNGELAENWQRYEQMQITGLAAAGVSQWSEWCIKKQLTELTDIL